jgi:SAM-dependent methyltransferase
VGDHVFDDALSYDRFMGRFSEPLARRFVELLGLKPGQRVLDVGCGTGILTRHLADAVGPAFVSAVDPSPPFVAAVRETLGAVQATVASAEDLPFADDAFDTVVAQLVVHFLDDPARGVAEMARVARPGGLVAASVWDFGGRRGPLGVFERATGDLSLAAPNERSRPGAVEGDLARLFDGAGLVDVESREVTVSVELESFDAWWEPFTLGAGPAGAFVRSLDPATRQLLQDHARTLVPDAAFTIDAAAWYALGRVPERPAHA